jgi:hypothetical protein
MHQGQEAYNIPRTGGQNCGYQGQEANHIPRTEEQNVGTRDRRVKIWVPRTGGQLYTEDRRPTIYRGQEANNIPRTGEQQCGY